MYIGVQKVFDVADGDLEIDLYSSLFSAHLEYSSINYLILACLLMTFEIQVWLGKEI